MPPGDFVHDDLPAIVFNRDVSESGLDIWINDFWGMPMKLKESHKSYRPLTTLSFRYFIALSTIVFIQQIFLLISEMSRAVISQTHNNSQNCILNNNPNDSCFAVCLQVTKFGSVSFLKRS